jgi:hypothetical protein
MSLMTIDRLEQLAQSHPIVSTAPPVEAAPKRVTVTARDARHQILGGIKIIARICGIDMTQDISPAEMLVQRIEQLEAIRQQQMDEIAELRKALSTVGTVLEVHSDPFELRPSSKWTKTELAQWIINADESRKWVMQRAENALDPKHIVPIAADPE